MGQLWLTYMVDRVLKTQLLVYFDTFLHNKGQPRPTYMVDSVKNQLSVYFDTFLHSRRACQHGTTGTDQSTRPPLPLPQLLRKRCSDSRTCRGGWCCTATRHTWMSKHLNVNAHTHTPPHTHTPSHTHARLHTHTYTLTHNKFTQQDAYVNITEILLLDHIDWLTYIIKGCLDPYRQTDYVDWLMYVINICILNN